MVFQASQQGLAEVFMPSKLATQSKDTELQRIRVVGRVAAAEIDYRVEPQFELRFHIVDPGVKVSPASESEVPAAPALAPASVPVYYQGIKPDMFAVGRDVIIDGEFSAGQVRAQKLLTQCPSKYEAPDPAKKYSAPSSQPQN